MYLELVRWFGEEVESVEATRIGGKRELVLVCWHA
jgi:hypothetical protein